MTTTEYMLATLVNGQEQTLPHCGSWYSDRYYADDLQGRAAAEAAADRVAEQAGGAYVVVAVRTFERVDGRSAADRAAHLAELRERAKPYAASEVRSGWVLLYSEAEREVDSVRPNGMRDGEPLLRMRFRDGVTATGEASQTVYVLRAGDAEPAAS